MRRRNARLIPHQRDGSADPPRAKHTRATRSGQRIAAIALLIPLTPILVTLSIAIKLDSPGPAFYRQERVGLRGKPFVMYKLRSMSDGTVHDGRAKVPGDPRVTRIGRLLRRYSLDEIPQLANVVLGNMAIVGPRPLLACDVGDSRADVTRLQVLPGITGLWQVSGRCTLSSEDQLRLDAHYVATWSHRLDARIILKTFRAVICGAGAY